MFWITDHHISNINKDLGSYNALMREREANRVKYVVGKLQRKAAILPFFPKMSPNECTRKNSTAADAESYPCSRMGIHYDFFDEFNHNHASFFIRRPSQCLQSIC